MPDEQTLKQHETIYLKDYAPPDYRIETVMLEFDLDETRTRVKSLLTIVSNHDRSAGIRPLVLNGEDLQLKAIRLDGRPLSGQEYVHDAVSLAIRNVPEQCTLEIETEINPRNNAELSGLYQAQAFGDIR